MKQFNLEEYLANPNKKVVTGSGESVRIICVDRIDDTYPIIALVHNEEREAVQHYTEDGAAIVGFKCLQDLFFVPEKKEKWVNAYRSPVGVNWLGENLYDTEEEAKADTSKSRVATVKIEWEE